MARIDWKRIWIGLRRYVVNKYFITFVVFAVVVTFMGDQSLINRIERAFQIRELRHQRDSYRQAIEESRHELNNLTNRDSLERFAREQYFMSAPGEDVYVIED